ncbi:putative lipoprotein YehR precursor [compost metagenome]
MLSLIAVLAACGGEVLTKTFERSEEGLVSALTYKYKNDKVVEQTANNTMTYDYLGVDSKEEAEKQLAPFIESYKGVEGITHKIEFKEFEATETLKVEYDKADFNKLKELEGMSFDSEEDVKRISMKKSEELLKSQGYTEKK